MSLILRTVLVTGGTGSFGKRFVATVLQRCPQIKCLVIFSPDELKQFEMAQQFSPTQFPGLRYFLGDVRDEQRLKWALEGTDRRKPGIAAKHAICAFAARSS